MILFFDIKFKTLKNSSFWFQEAKGLLGNEKLGDTRQETKAKKGKPAGPKRTSTIAKTMQEGNSDNSHSLDTITCISVWYNSQSQSPWLVLF